MNSDNQGAHKMDADISFDLREWREKFGLTQGQAASVLDVPARTYQGWEAGRPVERPRIFRLALKNFKKSDFIC